MSEEVENPLAAPATEAAPAAEITETQATESVVQEVESKAVNLKDMVGDDLSFNGNVFEKLPIDDGENPDKYKALGDKFNSVSSLAKSYLNLERMLSKDKMPIPTDNDGDEVWDQAYKALGRPETPDGYEAPEGLPPEAKEQTDKIFHEAGLSQKQASKLYANIAQALESASQNEEQSSQASVESAIQSLESEFGPRGGDAYQQALDKAQTVAKHLGLDVAEFWTMPGFAGKLASQYETLMGSKVRGVESSRISSAQSIDDQIHDIQNNPSNPYYTAYRDGDPAIHKRVLELFEQKAALTIQ
jgi:hypothetical protein